jgi:hypothetical protein
MKAYQFVGAKGKVWLPDWIKVDIRIIDHTRFRSFQPFTGQQFSVWHDTGNAKTDAEAEYRWAAGGRQGGSVGGYTFIFDDDQIIQTGPMNEVTWAQGDAYGNKVGWASEQAFGAGADFGKTLEIGAALHGGICAMMGWAVDTHLVKHQYWTGKWCPGQILNKGMWSQVVRMTSDAALKASVAASGGIASGPIYEKPAPISELAAYAAKPADKIPYTVPLNDDTICVYIGDRVQAIKDTPRLRYSAGDDVIGKNIIKGEEFDADFLLIHPDRPKILYSPWATRIRADDTVRVRDAKGDIKLLAKTLGDAL